MRRSFIITGILASFFLGVALITQGSGIVPAIVPALVPTANKTSTTSTVFALASSNALTASSPVCTNANGDMTTTACTANAVTSTSPVTVNANSTADQQMMELSLSAGYLNSLGRPFDFFGAGVYTTQAGQTPTLEFKIKLCTVSGCGSGTVVSLADITTTATTANSPNVSWNLRTVGTTNATGATGNLEVHGNLTADLGNLISTADTVFTDTNTAVSSNIDLTAALFVDFTIKFSTQPGTPFNAMTQREGIVSPGGSTAGGGGGGTTVTVAAPYITVAGTKYVAASMFPFTAFYSGSFLDGVTFTINTATNGSTLLTFTTAGTNAWYSVAATTSVEAEFYIGTIPAGSGSPAYGIWVCDNTNSKIYSFEVNNATLLSASWTETSCAGTPSSPTSIVSYPFPNGQSGLWHLKLVKSGGNVLGQASLDGGQTFVTYLTQAAGTLTKGGVDMRSSGSETTQNMNVLSVAVN